MCSSSLGEIETWKYVSTVETGIEACVFNLSKEETKNCRHVSGSVQSGDRNMETCV
jgi:hypothetical protein